MGVEDGRVKDREVFEANACRELVVHDPIEDGGYDASEDDFQGFDHRDASVAVGSGGRKERVRDRAVWHEL